MEAKDLSGNVDYLVRSLADSETHWTGCARFSPETEDKGPELVIEEDCGTPVILTGKALTDFVEFVGFLRQAGLL